MSRRGPPKKRDRSTGALRLKLLAGLVFAAFACVGLLTLGPLASLADEAAAERLRDDLTLVLVTVCSQADQQRFAMLGPTLRAFSGVEELLIVTSKACLARPDEVFRAFKGLGFPMRPVNEEDVLRDVGCRNAGHSMHYYARQMVLKLAVSRNEIRTKWYLTLDADILVVADSVGVEQLAPEGKAVWFPNSYNKHAEWWEASFVVLGDDRCKSEFEAEPDKRTLPSVTPFMMSTKIARLTWEKINRRFPDGHTCTGMKDWGPNEPDHSGIPSMWTEYTMYRIVACQTGLWDEFYQPKGTVKLYQWSQPTPDCTEKDCQSKLITEHIRLAKREGRLFVIAQDHRYTNPALIAGAVADELLVGKI